MFNPNRFSISTKDISFNLYVDSLYVGKGEVDNELILAKNESTNINTSLVINKSNLKSFSSLKDSVSLNILGSSTIPYISKKYYFDLKYNIYPNDLISFFVHGFIYLILIAWLASLNS